MLIAERFLLVSREPDGRPATSITLVGVLPHALTGALLIDLIGGGHLDVAGGRLHLRPDRPPTHPVLLELGNAVAAGQTALDRGGLRALTTAIGPDRVPRHLAEHGVVEIGRRRLLGPPRYPIRRTDLRDQSVHWCRQAVVADGPLAPEVAVLLRLSAAFEIWQLHVDAPDGRARAATATDRMQAPPATAAAVDEVLTAVEETVRSSRNAARDLDGGGWDDGGWDDGGGWDD